MLLILIIALIALFLLFRVNILREFVGAVVLAIGVMWIIRANGGNPEPWAPWIVGIFLFGAAIRWIYTLLPRKP